MTKSDFLRLTGQWRRRAGDESVSSDVNAFTYARATAGEKLPAPSLSPDGRMLAFIATISGEPQLWVVDVNGGWPRQLTFGGAVTFHSWSPTGEVIVYGADKDGDGLESYMATTPDGLLQHEILPQSNEWREFGGFLPDGRSILYATTGRDGPVLDIQILDLVTGRSRMAFEGRMGLFVESVSPSGTVFLSSEIQGEDANNLHLYDATAKQFETLFSPEERSAFVSTSWLPDESAFYMVTNHGRNFAGVAVYRLAERSLQFVETPNHDVERVQLSFDGRYLAWTSNVGGFSHLTIRDLKSGETQSTFDLPRGVITGLNWAAQVPVLAIALSGPKVPGDIWIFDASDSELKRATYSTAAGLDLPKMVVPEHHTYASRDGRSIHGLLYRPVTGAQEPPVVIDLHGGPTLQARPWFAPRIQYLLTKGIAVFEPNYRGSTGYGKAYARLNDRRKRERELSDILDAIDYLDTLGLDVSRSAVIGHSYGGYLALAMLTRFPDTPFLAGVAIAPISDWVPAFESAPPGLKASDQIEFGDVNDPKDRAYFEKISPMTHAAHLRTPLLVIQGASDPFVPVETSEQFVKVASSAGAEVKYLRFEEEGHELKKLSNRLDAYRRISEFLEEHLGLR